MQEEEQNMRHGESASLSESQIINLIQSCQYISHIVFSFECEAILEDKQVRSLMRSHLTQRTNKYSQEMEQQGKQTTLHFQAGNLEFYHEMLAQKIPDFQAICVQLFYFMFLCMKQVLMVHFHQQLFIFTRAKNRFMVVIKQISVIENAQIQTKTKNYYGLYLKIVKKLIQVVEQNFRFIQQTVKNQKNKPEIELQSKINYNALKLASLQLKQQDIKNMLRSIRQFIDEAQAIFYDSTYHSDQQCFSTLEKSAFICAKSNLFKIRNRSININLMCHSPVQKLQDALNNQKQLRNRYRQIKILSANNTAQLYDIYRKIIINFYKYAQEGWTVNPLFKQIVQQGQLNQFEQFLRQTELNKQQKKLSKTDNRINFKMILKSLKQMGKAENSKKEERQQILQYSIQINVSKSISTVRLFTPVSLEHYNMDTVLQSWNSLSYLSNHVCLEICERMEIMNKRRKFVVVKGICEYKPTQSMISTCLRTIDIVMASYTVIQTDLKAQAEDNQLSYKMESVEQIRSKLNHYTNLMADLNRKLIASISK